MGVAVGNITNSYNGVNRSTNTLSSKREIAEVTNTIVNRENGTNDSTNVINNEAQVIFATNQIINVYQLPQGWDYNPPPPQPQPSYPPCGGGCWSPPPCYNYNPWPFCCGLMAGFFLPAFAMTMFPFCFF